MNIQQVANVLTEKIPEKGYYKGWGRGEKYGLYGNVFERSKPVTKVGYCVTANEDTLRYCQASGINFLVAHHPILPYLLRFKGAIFIAHTALDCEPNFGLNRLWANQLDLIEPKHLMENLGYSGEVLCSLSELQQLVEDNIDPNSPIREKVYRSPTAPDYIGKAGIVTGMGGSVLSEVKGVDCYITGQLTQDVESLKLPFHVIEMGHTNSERIGVESIKEYLKDQEVEVVSIPLALDICVYGEAWRPSPIRRN